MESDTDFAGYFGPEKCLEILFPDEASRISLRHFRSLQASGYIPHLKLGRRTLFNPTEVRLALERFFKRKVRQ